MTKMRVAVLALTGLLATGSTVLAGGPPAQDGETKVSHEMATLDVKTETNTGGAELNAPGDTWRYTFIIEDEYINNPNYEVARAIMGVDMLDDDYVDGVDQEPEWGKILLDGEPRKWVELGAPGYREGEKSALTDLDEIDTLPETADLPPYVFFVPELIAEDGRLVLEVTNVREDGSIDGDAAYGDFIVLGAGIHVYYKEKK
ncbi:hypothetical protein [Roseibium sp.]|uniref:hypothetical protein n=1 Tax=Roseibium sp. TaxID=1936156 RepID=UPI003A985F49